MYHLHCNIHVIKSLIITGLEQAFFRQALHLPFVLYLTAKYSLSFIMKYDYDL